jgi:glyoxalase family protein
VTLVTADARRAVAFYAGVLGLRVVKRTVSYDDPLAHHLYLGDALGRPGSLLTLVEWAGLPPGRVGIGAVHHLALRLASTEDLGRWALRLTAAGVPIERACEGSIEVLDPDGCRIELMAPAEPGADPRPLGLDHVLAVARDLERTAAWCERALGLRPTGESAFGGDGNAPLWTFGAERALRYFALRLGGKPVGHVGPGTVHHVAFRVPDERALGDWLERLREGGVPTSPVLDRLYFRSVFFRDPDGNIFELATDGPGFTVDEPAGELGGGLRLPPWLEPRRAELQSRLGAL